MSRPRAWLTAALVGALAITAACGSAPAGDPAKTLSVGATAEPPTLDPTASSAAAIPQVLLYNVYEGLVKLDGKGKIQPLLAKSWTESADRRTYIFHLRAGITFSNGDPLTSTDVLFSFDRVIAPKSNHPFKAQMAPVRTVTAAGPETVVVQLKQPSNNWLFSLTGTVGIVYDRNAIGTIATKPVGSGPYTFRSWVHGTSITLDRNRHYWGKPAELDRVVFRYFSDPNAMNNYLLTDQLDVISNVQAPQTIPEFSDRSKYTVDDGTTNGEVVLALNNSRGPLRDKRVRQAINYAIDRKALVKTAWAGYGTLIGSMVPPTDPWYQNLSGRYPYDPAKAKRLLAQAGYAKGFSLQLKLPTLPYATAAGQVVASALGQLGIKVHISELEFPARWLDVVFTKADYDMSIVSHVEPRDIVQYGNPSYYWRYRSPQVTRWLAEADAGSPQQQITIMRRVARQISDDAASDWLFLLPNLMVERTGVTGIPVNAVSLSFDVTAARKASDDG
ncbi:MAG TPA: ABC transporter substrate-binding protein [Mycobacteriales bacterium]|nr:ABC transporter substrate-binding protein [Mycobacteriales bacterium]